MVIADSRSARMLVTRSVSRDALRGIYIAGRYRGPPNSPSAAYTIRPLCSAHGSRTCSKSPARAIVHFTAGGGCCGCGRMRRRVSVLQPARIAATSSGAKESGLESAVFAADLRVVRGRLPGATSCCWATLSVNAHRRAAASRARSSESTRRMNAQPFRPSGNAKTPRPDYRAVAIEVQEKPRGYAIFDACSAYSCPAVLPPSWPTTPRVSSCRPLPLGTIG